MGPPPIAHVPPGMGPMNGPPAPLNPSFMYGSSGQAASVGVTGALGAMGAGAQPPDPYAPPPAIVSRAVLQGGAGVFTVTPGIEMRVGRDGAQCGILLTEPRVSGVHATARIDAGQFQLRDDNSNNGTVVNGNRLNPGVWTPVPNGSLVRFGPVEFSIRLE
ncbi:MAG: FHA domain-containing protein [Polyangiaceae bacterium]|nr:FHA domain-containing protein [Polyangiaceae bacterium]